MAISWTEEQKQVITTHGCNILVSAAAGSGKTAVLVERIIRMITDEAHPVDVDQLLVVTFTEAAAAQMKDRICEAIEERLKTQPDNERLSRQAAFIHHAQITTIHSFCLSVIRDHFPEIGLDPAFRIGEEGELKLLRQDVLEEVLEEKYQEKDPRFLRFASSYGVGKNDRKIEGLILKIYEYAESYPDGDVWLTECVNLYRARTVEEFLDNRCIRFIYEICHTCLENARDLLSRAYDIAGAADGPTVYLQILEANRRQLEDLLSAADYQELSRQMQSLFWGRMPVNRDKTVSEEKKEEVKRLRTKVKELTEDLKKQYFSQSIPQMMEACAHCLPMAEEMVSLTRLFAKRFAQRKREKNMIDFSDMEHGALRILTEKTERGFLPSRIAREYQALFAEVMIDEYQDSNLIQETILASVSREGKGMCNRFMVGDVKQSIYRFRLSRPDLFLKKFETYKNIGGRESSDQSDLPDAVRIDLHKNFRSRFQVIDVVNGIFRQLMRARLGGVEYDEQAKLHVGASYPETGGMDAEVLVIDTGIAEEFDAPEEKITDRETEARVIAAKIRQLKATGCVTDEKTGALRRVRYRDIVILTRSIQGYGDVITEVLNREGIPALAQTREGYFATQEIGVILNYLRLLNNGRQEIPLAAALSSPIGACSVEDLANIRIHGQGRPFYEAYASYKENGEDEALKKKLCRFSEVYDGLRQRAPYTPMHELLTAFLDETGYGDIVAAMPGGDRRRANVDMLVEKARAYEATGYKGLFHFVRYIEKLQKYNVDYGEAGTQDEQSDAVRVMTIHKSKGLEFPVVFVSGMGKRFNQQDATSRIVLHARLGIGMDAVDIEKRTRMVTLTKRALQKEEMLETLGEELRILYVALTRAKEKLILTGTLKQAAKKLEQYRTDAQRADERLSFLQLSKASGYWDWLLPAVLRLEGRLSIRLTVTDLRASVESEIREEVRSGALAQALGQRGSEQEQETGEKNAFDEQFSWKYPYPADKGRKLKYTVSELKKRSRYSETLAGDLQEEAGEELYREPEVVPLLPRFRTGEETELTGASRGTAYHRFLELFDFAAEDVSQAAIEDALEGFVRQGRITQKEAQAVNIRDVRRFLTGNCGRRMHAAAARGKLWREQPFVLGAEDPDGGFGEQILVQGIIDVFFEETDGLVLLDYKTDRVMSGEELRERYHTQLDYYARALTQITKKPVKERWIYSFALGEEIRV